MKRLLILVITAFLLVSCGKAEKADFTAAFNAAQSINQTTVRNVSTMLEVTFSSPVSTLYCTQGTAEYDKKALSANAVLSTTYLAATQDITCTLKDGVLHTVSASSDIESEVDASVYLSTFPFCDVFIPATDSVIASAVAKNAYGSLYTLTVNNGQEDFIGNYLNIDLPSLAKLNKPITEKTEYGDMKLEYTVTDDGKLYSSAVSLSVTCFETPPYTPGYSPEPEKITLNVIVRMTFGS